MGWLDGFLIPGFFSGHSGDGGMRWGRWVCGSSAPGVELVGKGFGGTTLGACTGDWITGGDGMTGTLSSVDESFIIKGNIYGITAVIA